MPSSLHDMRYFLTFIFLFISLNGLLAQSDYGAYYGITCTTRDTTPEAFMPAPAAFLNGTAELKTDIILDFTDDVPGIAQAAMRFAANVWASYLDSEVPVRVNVDWQDRDNEQLLASAGPATLFRDFAGGEPNTWYPVALAEAIAGRDLNAPADADINVIANSTANWYFGTDGNTPRNRIDLVSVMLHEMGHGLGFLSSVDTIGTDQLGIGFDNRFIVYDLFMETSDGLPLSDASLFGNPSPELLAAATMNELVFDGPLAVRENDGEVVPLFAPGTFDVGSSVSHLNEGSYAPGTENALMTPFLSAGEAVHDPGPVTLGLFADMGWPLVFQLVSTRSPVVGELAVFPNPAAESVQITPAADARPTTAVLYDATGRAVRRFSFAGTGARVEISVRDLPSALYTLLLEDGERVWRSRLVVR